jgi:mevalonate kinase
MANGELQRATASAAGKVILLGEHVVVHGHPALVAGIDRGVRVTIVPGPPAASAVQVEPALASAIALAARLLRLEGRPFAVEIAGDLPVGMGLGSSAALAVALLRALAASAGETLRDDAAAARAHEIERLFHGTPSGVDSTRRPTAACRKFAAGPPLHHSSDAARAVAAGGRAVANAARDFTHRRRPARAPPPPRGLPAGVRRDRAWPWWARRARARGDEARPARRAHDDEPRPAARLRRVHAQLDALVDLALDAGALGAKLTGGEWRRRGDRAARGRPERLLAALTEARPRGCFPVVVGAPTGGGARGRLRAQRGGVGLLPGSAWTNDEGGTAEQAPAPRVSAAPS